MTRCTSNFVQNYYKSRLQVVWAVEVAVGDGFHDVVGEDVGAAFEVGDGAGDFEYHPIFQ